jgi:hypothetical protein
LKQNNNNNNNNNNKSQSLEKSTWIVSWSKSRQRHSSYFEIIIHIVHIVAYRPVAKQWLCKHRPLLVTSATFTHATIEERRFLCGPRRDCCCATQRYNNRGCVFCGVRAEELSWRRLTLQESVEGSRAEC